MRKRASSPIRRFLGLEAEPRRSQIKALWRLDEASEYLGITVPALRGLIHRRRVPHVKVGRVIRFRQNDLEAWVMENTRAAVR